MKIVNSCRRTSIKRRRRPQSGIYLSTKFSPPRSKSSIVQRNVLSGGIGIGSCRHWYATLYPRRVTSINLLPRNVQSRWRKGLSRCCGRFVSMRLKIFVVIWRRWARVSPSPRTFCTISFLPLTNFFKIYFLLYFLIFDSLLRSFKRRVWTVFSSHWLVGYEAMAFSCLN